MGVPETEKNAFLLGVDCAGVVGATPLTGGRFRGDNMLLGIVCSCFSGSSFALAGRRESLAAGIVGLIVSSPLEVRSRTLAISPIPDASN